MIGIASILRSERTARRWRLLYNCSLSFGLVASALPTRAGAQAFQATPSVVSGSVTIDRTLAGQDRITTGSRTAIIDWTPTDRSGSGTIAFLPQGNVATYTSVPTIGANYVVLNRVLPTDTIRAIAFSGTVQSFSSGTTPGGALWFYNPGGIILTATANFNIGSLLLTADPVAVDANNNLFGAGGQIQLRPGPTPGAAVTVMNGAIITASPAGSYVALVAPVVNQDGMISVNGAAALVAAESVDLTVNTGLFDIHVNSGSGAGGTILEHSGSTTGLASTGDPHRLYVVAVSKGDAFSMLLSGTLGFQPATMVGVVNGEIILASGRDISGGDPRASPPAIGSAGSINLTNATITSPATLFASGTAQITASGAVPLARIDAPQSITISTDAVTGTAALSSGGPISLTGGNLSFGNVVSGASITANTTGLLTAAAMSASNSTSVSAGGAVTLASIIVGDDLAITAGSANLGTLSATYTGGTDYNGDGSNLRVTTAGDLTVGSASAVHSIALTAGSGGTGTLRATGTLHTDAVAITLVNQGSGDIDVATVDANTDATLTTTGGAINATGIGSRVGNITASGASMITVPTLSARNVSLTATGPITATSLTSVVGATITTPAAVAIGTITVGDDLAITAGSANLGTLSATYTGGTDYNGDGSNLRVTTAGDLTVGSASAVHSIALTAGSGGTGTLRATGTLHTDAVAITLVNQGSGDIDVATVDANTDATLTTTGGAINATGIGSRVGNITASGASMITVPTLSARNVSLTATGPITATSLTSVVGATITTPAAVAIGTITVGDDLAITAGSANLGTLSATYTGGTDYNGDGSNLRVTTAGDLTVGSAHARYTASPSPPAAGAPGRSERPAHCTPTRWRSRWSTRAPATSMWRRSMPTPTPR